MTTLICVMLSLQTVSFKVPMLAKEMMSGDESRNQRIELCQKLGARAELAYFKN